MQHFVATVEDIGLEDEPRAKATLEVSDHVVITATDDNPFWAMCELKLALNSLGVTGTLEGIHDGAGVFDPFQCNGLRIEVHGR